MISIVVPTLNEAAMLLALVESLSGQGVACEIIVVDGGSIDGTPALARALGVRVLHAPPGRGRQLAAGAARARGDILLFLHADSLFPEGGLERVRQVLSARQEVIGGNFRLLFDGDDGFSRWLTGFYAWMRTRGLYYGDSAVFVRRSVYDALGGMRAIDLMEDYDFTRRLEASGKTVCIEDPPLITSSRRFEGRRPFAIVWGWLKIHALYHLGVSPRRLSEIYDSERRREGRTPSDRRYA